MGTEDVPLTVTLESISQSVVGSLSAMADEVMVLSARTSALLRRQEQERARVQQFIDHFAVGSMLTDLGVDQVEADVLSTQVNRRVVRRDIEALDRSIARAQLLHLRLSASHRVLREMLQSFEGDQGEPGIGGAGDIRLQQATMAAREDERSRLAREIHDGPAQVFANAIFALEIAEQVSRRDPARVPDELTQLRTLLKDGVAEMRRFMADLRPAMLADRGLVPTLQRYITDFNRFFARQVVFTGTDVPETLTSEQQLTLFRIVQEGLQNIQKHSGSDSGQIDISMEGRTLALTIVDQGRGFDPSAPIVGTDYGAGLSGLRERARLIGADLEIISSPGSGTTIRVRVPLPVQPQTTTPDPSSNGSIQ